MPEGSKDQNRPVDVIGNAVKVMRVAAGEDTDVAPLRSAAATLGSLGDKVALAILSK